MSRAILCCWLVALSSPLVSSFALAQDAPVHDIAGIYEMDGETTVEGAPDRFHVSGKLVIRQDGLHCDINVDGEFRRVEGTSGPASIALIGTGEATLEGDVFSGTAELQTIMSEIAGVDVKAAYMPKKFGPMLEAVALGEVVAEGVIEFEIRSTVVGEGFTLPVNRRTVVRATRVARSPLELKNKVP
jgi:hypothetical protein